MAAPTPTTRQQPGTPRYKLPDGFKSEIAFSLIPDLRVWEITLTPPTLDGGDAIDTTTMLNTKWHTMAARQLVKMDPFKVTAAYDPDVISNLVTQLLNNDTGSVTFLWPDGTTFCFWGYLQKVEFKELKEGEFPQVDMTIVPTNWDKANQVEAGPVLTQATGT